MTKVAALILSYGTTDFLKPCIRQYKWCDKILVLNYLFPQSDPIDDNTPEICMGEGVECITGGGLNQEDVLNNGLAILRDYTLAFIADNDEFILQADQKKLVDEWKRDRYGKAYIPIIDYYKSLYEKYEQRTHHPVVLGEPNGVRFYNVRNSMGGGKYFEDIYLHHLGFLFSEKKMEWKKRKQKKTNLGGFIKCISRPTMKYEPPEELVKLLGEA